MPNRDTNVIIRPRWSDIPCRYGFYWFSLVIADAISLGLTVVDLPEELARKVPLNDAISIHDPIFFTGMGHGNADIFSGQEREILMQTCSGDEILVDRITYLLSCMTARTLGLDIINKGGLAYLGYIPSYTWMGDTNGDDCPIDRYDKAYCDTSNAISMLINRLGFTDFAKQAILQQARLWMAWWEKSEDPYASSVIKYLLLDYLSGDDPLRHYGVPSRRKEETGHIPLLQVIRPSRIALVEDMVIQVMLTCPQGCNLTGQKVKIVDESGATQAELELTHQENGVNYSDYHIVPVTESGRRDWKAVYESDGTHTRQETAWTFKAASEIVVTGVVTDAMGKTPLELVRVSGIGEGSLTNANGVYMLRDEDVLGTVKIMGYRYAYLVAYKMINITGQGKYICDLEMPLHDLVTWNLTIHSQHTVTFLINKKPQTSPITIEVSMGYNLVEAPEEIISGDKTYRFIKWEDETTNPSRLIYMSATKNIVAIYEEAGMAIIHAESSEPFTFVVVGEEHDTITKVVEKFASATPGEIKAMKVGTVCGVEGQVCNLVGKTIQVIDHNGAVVAEAALVAWDTINGCYVSNVFNVAAPSGVGEYTWLGKFLRQ